MQFTWSLDFRLHNFLPACPHHHEMPHISPIPLHHGHHPVLTVQRLLNSTKTARKAFLQSAYR